MKRASGRAIIMCVLLIASAVSAAAQSSLPVGVPVPDADALGLSPDRLSASLIAPPTPVADALHLALGISTVVVGGLTGLLNPESVDYQVHHALGLTTAGLAVGTLATGVWAHRDEIGIIQGWSYTNVHAVLGVTGSLLMIAAALLGPTSVTPDGESDAGKLHAVIGAGGEALMGLAIVWPILFKSEFAP